MDVRPQSADPAAELKSRKTGGTEQSWCKAVPTGTGITVLSVLGSKPVDVPFLQNVLKKLQVAHPILKSRICFDPNLNSFTYAIPVNPGIQLQRFDPSTTTQILKSSFGDECDSISPLHLLLEHELNCNPWRGDENSSLGTDVFFATLYELENGKWVLALRLHTSVCDRVSAATLLKELLEFGGAAEVPCMDLDKEMENCLPIEDQIPRGHADKPIWARAVDMLGYSLNFLRFSNLNFIDLEPPLKSRIARLQMSKEETSLLLTKCETEEIKLGGVIAAACLIATHSSKDIPDGQYEKYSVVTLIDCRSLLDPILSKHHVGFYHSAILNSHDVEGGENLWSLGKRVHSSFLNAKKNRKHFTDMGDMNFLMCKAIENPGLTPSGSMRTSLISIFEETEVDNSNKLHEAIGVEDFIGCSSVHGIGPSLAVFDTIRDGKLDCACVFPFPLHSRKQIQELVDHMKKVILEETVDAAENRQV